MRVFVDSNLLVYALAQDDLPRQAVARRVLAQHCGGQSLVLSPQVLLETYNVLTRKKRVSAGDAAAALGLLAQQEVATPTAETALQAMALGAAHGLSVWDALIVQTALQAGCDTLYSEDLQAGRRFGALEVVNPFALAAHESAPAFAARSSAPARPPRRKAGPKPATRRV